MFDLFAVCTYFLFCKKIRAHSLLKKLRRCLFLVTLPIVVFETKGSISNEPMRFHWPHCVLLMCSDIRDKKFLDKKCWSATPRVPVDPGD